MVDWIIILHIHICREEPSFQRLKDVRFGESGRDKELIIYVAADQCKIIGRRQYNGSDACDPDGQPMKVHRCDGHGKVYCAPAKSMLRREWQLLQKCVAKDSILQAIE